jgi:spectinomycin phosphotransferase
MLEKPDIRDEIILSALAERYALRISALDFLPVGADRHSVSYRAAAEDARTYFIKLRGGPFDETSVLLPRFLAGRGVAGIIPPLETQDRRLWTGLGPFALIVYPFIDGRDGYEVALSGRQWNELGAALKRVHTIELPAALSNRIRKETFPTRWAGELRDQVAWAEGADPDDPIAAELACTLSAKRGQLLDLAARVEHLARALQERSPEFILCHSDVHAGNVLIEPDGSIYLVDWDDPIIAPKERDLMFIGGGYWGRWLAPQEEEAFFYRGYGEARINPLAMAYYRYGRIVEDIALFSAHIAETKEGREDRQQSLRYLTSGFLPNGALDRAYSSDMSCLGR